MEKTTSTAEEVFELLKAQHEHIKKMLAQVMDTMGAARNSAFGALERFTAVHQAAEETFIHSLEHSPVAQERVREEEKAGQLMARLEAMDTATEAFEDAFAKFAASMMVHMEAEEYAELPELTRDASPQELGRMYNALQRVPELAGRQGGRMAASADFASMRVGAKAEFSALSSQ
jgi:hypothetical protein